ncbi:hypothetical protein [Rasiella sp. SM2506]|uniref:hypothetical protein n=1 Tax=Rasiella sp. SM2506 TaxID=3423914 RepID=UPI003D79FE09
MGFYNQVVKILWILALAFVSCVDGEKNSNSTLNEEGSQTIAAMDKKDVQIETIPQLKYFYNTDKRNGMATERIPFPANWEQHNSGEFAFTGPNGIKVYGEGGQYYSYSNDPLMMELYQRTGVHVKYPMNMEETINEVLMPIAKKLNRKMVKKYPIPQLLEGYKNFSGMIFKVAQNPTQFNATAIEWVDPDGTRWVTVFFYQLEQGKNDVLWGFQAGAVGAPSAYFEQAKQDYLNGMLNKQINPQWINTMNQQTAYTIQKSEEAHAKRQAEFKRGMAERQKQWEANQDAISRRNEMVSDVILGKVNIIDPDSGVKTKIDHNNNRYWVNSQNKYIGTNNSYDDPNKNYYLNGETWREFKIDDYKH